MRDWTYNELKTEVENELDIQRDTIVSPVEMLGYCNSAIDEAEAEIHKLGIEDEYFLSRMKLPLTSGEDEYGLPADIYANKINRIIYRNGSDIFEIKRMRNSKRFLEVAEIEAYTETNPAYQYMILNVSTPVTADATTGRKLVLFPPSQETSTTNVSVWYTRNAGRVTTGADIIDIPEASNFLKAYMKAMCRAKENGGELSPSDVALVQAQRTLMVETLTEMVPDSATEIEGDFSHYQEHI